MGRKCRLLLGFLSSESRFDPALGPSAVADFEGGADGGSRLSLRAMVSTYGCSKGVENWSQSHTVASLKVPLPVGVSAEA